jgi:hypothetical protein
MVGRLSQLLHGAWISIRTTRSSKPNTRLLLLYLPVADLALPDLPHFLASILEGRVSWHIRDGVNRHYSCRQ